MKQNRSGKKEEKKKDNLVRKVVNECTEISFYNLMNTIYF